MRRRGIILQSHESLGFGVWGCDSNIPLDFNGRIDPDCIQNHNLKPQTPNPTAPIFAPIMATDSNRFQAIISHCKEYGFIFPSSEIYDGLAALYMIMASGVVS